MRSGLVEGVRVADLRDVSRRRLDSIEIRRLVFCRVVSGAGGSW